MLFQFICYILWFYVAFSRSVIFELYYDHLPKARDESCSAATTLALYVKNFPGWPTLFRLRWGRPIREVAYTVTYILTSWMIKICMLSTFLNFIRLRGRMVKTLDFWSRGREFKPRSWQLFFLSVIWRNYFFFLIVHYYVLSIAITINLYHYDKCI